MDGVTKKRHSQGQKVKNRHIRRVTLLSLGGGKQVNISASLIGRLDLGRKTDDKGGTCAVRDVPNADALNDFRTNDEKVWRTIVISRRG